MGVHMVYIKYKRCIWVYKVYVGVQKKNRIFLKGLVHNFVQKIKHFPCFYLGQNRQEKKMC